MIAVGIILVLWSALAVFAPRSTTDDPAWDGMLSSPSPITRKVASLARPLARTRFVQRNATSSTFANLGPMLSSTGMYGASAEVFWSLQVLAIAGAASIGGVLLAVDLFWFWRFVLGALAALVVAYPYQSMKVAYDTRIDRVSSTLPDFAELLVLVLPTMGVKAALSFCAARTDGPIAEEMTRLVQILAARPSDERAVFVETAARLGPREAFSFLDALYTAYVENTKVVSALTAQAESMRRVAYQRRRAQMKKLPTKLVFVFALHFMPLLFILAFLPVVITMAGAL